MKQQTKTPPHPFASIRQKFRLIRILLVAMMCICLPYNTIGQNHLDTNATHDNRFPMEANWSKDIYIKALSPNGNWVVITEDFPVSENKMYLIDTSNKQQKIELKDAFHVYFSSNSQWLASLATDKTLTLINTATGHRQEHNKIQKVGFSYDGNYIAMIQKMQDDTQELRVRNLKTNKTATYQNNADFLWNPVANTIAVVQKMEDKSTLLQVDVEKDKIKTLFNKKKATLQNISWNATGTALVARHQTNEELFLEMYDDKGNKNQLNDDFLQQYVKQYKISNKNIWLADDGSKVLFYREPIHKPKQEQSGIEIWNTSDAYIYPRLKQYKTYIEPYLLTAWYPKKDTVIKIATKKHPSVAMNVNHDIAFLYNKIDIEKQYSQFPKADIYVKRLKSDSLTLVVKNQSLQGKKLAIAPNGNGLAYFNDENWWFYDVVKNKHSNLTENIKEEFVNTGIQYPIDREEVVGGPVWSPDSSTLFLHGEYDIWKIDVNTNATQNITNGKAQQRQFTISKELKLNFNSPQTTATKFTPEILNVKDKFFIEIKNFTTQETGLARYDGKSNLNTLVFEKQLINKFRWSKNLDKIVFVKQNTTQPKALFSYDLATDKQSRVYQTNKGLRNKKLGAKEIINYKGSKNENLQGVLLYPVEYDPEKKYPMVTYIYEKTSRKAMEFIPPYGYYPNGFSSLNYTTDGYFVLFPDISYTLQNPGFSALASVNAAIDKALETASIDKSRLGLYGHSFGGYEAAFIATQSKRFAAIAAGAAVTNFTSHYHGINANGNDNDMWRYEDQQWRMGRSYYENKNAYIQNSPMEHVQNVSTPLLLWTGDKDYQITWTQSIEMFMALNRLNHPAKLLLIKGEAHTPWKTENQLNLSKELKKWFDQYCKK